MQWIRFAVIVAIITFLQASGVLGWVALAHLDVRPDLLLVLLVFFALEGEGAEAVITSFALGLAADIISFVPGPYLISFGLCGSLLSMLRRYIQLKKPGHIIIAVFFTGMATGLIATMLSHFKGSHPASAFVKVFGISAYSSLLAPYLFYVLNVISAWLGVKKYHSTR